MHVLHGVVCYVVICVWCTLCVYAHAWGEGTGRLSGVVIDLECVQDKEKGRSKYQQRTSINILFQFYYACDLWFWCMMTICDLRFWFMMVTCDLWSMMVVFNLKLCDMFIYVDLVKYASLNYCDRKWTWLQMYLIDKLLVRYGMNLFQFISNLMEVMCLVQECMKCLVGWLELTARISSNQKRSLGFCIFRCEEALPRDELPEMGVLVELGRWVTTWKGWMDYRGTM